MQQPLLRKFPATHRQAWANPLRRRDLSTLPATGPLKRNATTPAFTVNVAAREQVRQFYNAVYSASEGAQIDSSNDTANCVAVDIVAAFQTAILWRINWFGPRAGFPPG